MHHHPFRLQLKDRQNAVTGQWKKLVSLGCFERITAMLVRLPLLVGWTILRQAGGLFGNIPSSSVRISSCKLSGPSPASVCARIVMPYSVHFSRFSRRYGELSGGIPSILLVILLPSVVEYWMEYPVMTPFWNSRGGGAQLTRMLVELGLVHVMSWGGAEGTDWPVFEEAQ